MNPRHAVVRLVAILMFAAAQCELVAQANQTDYEAKLKEARAHAAQESWALARDAYAAALPLAPDAASTRWTKLWLVDATWRAEDIPSQWQARSRWTERHGKGLDALLTDYTDKTTRDEFWVAAMRSRLEFLIKAMRSHDCPAILLEVADHLASRPLDALAIDAYLDLVQSEPVDTATSFLEPETKLRWQTHLDRAVELARNADEKALLLVRATKHRSTPGNEDIERLAVHWDEIAVVAKGTRIEPLAEALRFLFYSMFSYDPSLSQEAPADVTAMIEEIDRHYARLLPMAEQVENALTPLRREAAAACGMLLVLRVQLLEPHLILDAPGELITGEPLTLRYAGAGYSEIRITTLSRTPADLGREPDRASRFVPPAGSFQHATERAVKAIRSGARAVVREQVIPMPEISALAWHTGEVQMAERLDPGFYTLLAEASGPTEAVAWTKDIVVTDIAVTSMASRPGDTTFLFREKATNRPLAREKVRGTIRTQNNSTSFEGTTDADGMLTTNKGFAASNRLLAFVNSQPVAVSFNRASDRTASVLHADAILDRPLYRPGETVHWKLILRERSEGKFKVARTRVFLRVEDEQGEALVDRLAVDPGEFGTANGSFVIPESTKPGRCDIAFLPTKDAKDWDFVASEAFLVDNFVPPAITSAIELAGPPDSLQPGGEIRIRVRSTYFSGGPVVGATATLRFHANPGWTHWEARREGSAAVDDWLENLRNDVRTAETDADGLVEFPLLIPPVVSDGTTLHLSAIVAPRGAQASEAQARWSVNRTGVSVDPLVWKIVRAARPGEIVEFLCKVSDGRGNPVPFSGDAAFVELTWNEAWLNPEGKLVTGDALARVRKELGVAFNGDLPPDWEKLHSGYSRRAVAKARVESSGDGLVRAKFTPPQSGLFQLELLRAGSVIPMKREWGTDLPLAVVAADESTQMLAVKPGFYLLGQPVLTSGAPLRLLAIAPEGIGPCVLAVSGENNHLARRIEFAESVAWIEVPDLPGFAGGGRAALASLSDPSIPAAEHDFDFADPSSRITLVVAPREEEARPGSEAGVVLRAIDSSGRPRRSEIVLGVADEAVRRLSAVPEGPDFSEDENSGASFLDFRFVSSISVSHSTTAKTSPSGVSMRDPRPGAIRSPRGRLATDEDMIVLSPFVVGSSGEGFYAANTLAGTRVRTNLEQIMPPPPPPMYGGRRLDGADTSPPPVITRRFFASTAAWLPEIVTDANGEARVSFKYPDNLTQWHFDAYAVGADGNTFGRTSVLTRTSLPLQARIQAPRFLTEGDRSDVGVLLLNRTDGPLTADASLAVEGAAAIDRSLRAPKTGVAVSQQGEARVTWPVAANEVGFAKLTTTSRAGGHGDAMEIALPVLPDGFWQETVASGRLADDAREQALHVRLPDPLDPAKTKVALKFSPGHVPALLDALPYLVDYPYGCVEQTMSRFLPALVVRKTLVELGLEEDEVESRIVAKETAADRARRENTAGLLKIDEVAEKSLTKLAEAQSHSGGFGWWPGQNAIDPWMTAYVVWGLSIARECGFDAPGDMEEDARGVLCRWMESTDETNDVLAWALFAASRSDLETKEAEAAATVFKRVMAGRAKLGAAGRACLVLAAKRWGSAEDRATLLANLENGATHSQAAGYGATVHWGSASGYWRAMDGAVECTALTLLALLELDPKHQLVDAAANWLALNRKSARWSNTRDTALAVLALSELVARDRTLATNATVELVVNGSHRERLTINRETLLQDGLEVAIPTSALRPGDNKFNLRLSSGDGPVFALAMASAWSHNEGAHPAAHLVEASREFDRRVPTPTVSGKVRFSSESVSPGGVVRQGEEVIAVVTLTVPNELEYLAIEVPKPAGCEPLNPLSGWDARIRRVDQSAGESKDDAGRPIYREEHDSKSVFFLDHIESGTWEIRFGLRATFSGDYRAAPVVVEAMYAPEIRANTDARRIRIEASGE